MVEKSHLKKQSGERWSAHLSVPDVGGQHLVLLILGKERGLTGGPTHTTRQELVFWEGRR